MSDFFDIEGNSVSPNITLGASIHTLLNTPIDIKLCNFYHRLDSIIVETIAEYLERIIVGERVAGGIVTVLLPKEGYTPAHSYDISAFPAALTNFDIKYYGFVGGLADENFVEIDMGGGVTEVFAQDHGYIPRLLDLKYTKGGTDYHITTIKKLDGIIYGGKLIWLGGLSFFLQTTVTAFFGNIYFSSGLITHDAADGTYDRLDVVATTSENTVSIVKGTPSANPVKPVLAPGTHKEVTTILIKAGSTTPDGITGTVVYNENIEWTVSASGLTIDADSTTDPFIGDVCIDASDAGNGDEIIFTSGANENVADYSEITLQTKLKTAFTTKQYGIYVAFYQDTKLVSNIVTLPLEALNNGWQNFVLNFSEFSFTGTTFNKIVVGFINSSGTDFPGFYLDYIVLQKGIIQPPVVDSHPPVTIAENSKKYLKIGPDQKLEIAVDELPGGTGEENVQSDWNQTDNTADDYIKNKPTIPTNTDEKVKYDAADTTAGYLSEKIVAGANITIEEGTGADENKLKISATGGGGSTLFPDTITSETTNSETETTHTHELGKVNLDKVVSGVPVEYGALYNWWAVTDVRKITSSDDWVVPSIYQYQILADYLGASGDYLTNIIGGKLKETGYIYWDSPNTDATNEVGFNGRGNGWRTSGLFSALNNFGHLWTTSVFFGNTSVEVYISYNSNTFRANSMAGINRDTGMSLRLLYTGSGTPTEYIGNDGKRYPVFLIGTQRWITMNLNETKYRNGDWITGFDGGVYTPISNSAWAALTTEAMCYYDDNEAYGGGETPLATLLHPPVTIHPDSAALASIDENQVLTITPPTGGSSVIQNTATLVVANWVADGALYKYVLSDANITATSSVEVIPANASYDVLVAAEPRPETESATGSVTMWVKNVPSADIPVTINITEVV